MHKGSRHRDQDPEKEADQFAAEFLLPESSMRQILTKDLTLTNATRLKSRWKVSMQAIVRRARDLGIITERRYRHLFTQIGKRGWRTVEPGDVPVERPRLFRQMAEMVYRENKAVGLASSADITVPLATMLLDQYDSILATPWIAETGPLQHRPLGAPELESNAERGASAREPRRGPLARLVPHSTATRGLMRNWLQPGPHCLIRQCVESPGLSGPKVSHALLVANVSALATSRRAPSCRSRVVATAGPFTG